MAVIERVFDTVGMDRRPHPRLAAANARSAERMRQAAQQLREEQGPVKHEARVGLARLLDAVAEQAGSHNVGTYVWGGAGAVANALLAEPLDQGIVNAIERERAGTERARSGGGITG
jgi:hypothetical protein